MTATEGDSNTLNSTVDVTHSMPPSHILEDGRFVYLPSPNRMDRSRFFERSIARHGLLEADMMGKKSKKAENKKDDHKDDDKDDDQSAPKIHPLALASAKLQANGLAELNRVINLAGLTNSGEYFGLTTIVDPNLEAESKTSEGGAAALLNTNTTDAVKSTFVLKRKRAQFAKATQVVERHKKRLRAAIQAQRTIDQRLFRLRQQWRLVAPEHGTRARLHAARPTEIVAIDIDVYDRDRVGGGNQALAGNESSSKKQSLAGRLASRVPRFATIELNDDYKVQLDDLEDEGESKLPDDPSKWTRAEPFAVADPTLGRVMENFDPSKVPMLNLQLEIQKSSTGFMQFACLKPMTTLSVAQDATNSYSQDEDLLVTLQHSLFCASLFESIRSELDPIDTTQQQFQVSNTAQSAAWLSCESEENFLPPPSRLVGGDLGRGLASLSVVYCHEGEVKVQLDSEYTLCIKLVEATADEPQEAQSTTTAMNDSSSGSQTPAHLHALCRALLLHAQDVYHQHSLYLRERAKRKQEEEAKLGDGPRGLARIKKEDIPEKPKILQSCVSLGSKMLFEQRIRKAILTVSKWLKEQSPDKIIVEWLALSVFDLQSHFTLSFQDLVLDVNIVRHGMTVTQICQNDSYRKVQFHSGAEFEVFLKLQLQRCLSS